MNKLLLWQLILFGEPLNDQYPYMSDEEFYNNNKFVKFERVSDVKITKAESHE